MYHSMVLIFFPPQSYGRSLKLYEPEHAIIRFGFVRTHSGSNAERAKLWTKKLVETQFNEREHWQEKLKE